MDNFKKAFAIIGKTILVFVVFFGLFIFVLGAIVGPFRGIDENLVMRISFILQTICMIWATLAVYLMFDKKKGLYLGWKQKNAIRLGIEGCIWGIAFITVTFFLLWIFRGVRIQGIGLNRTVLSGMTYPLILFVFVAINEELLSRGYLYGLIKRDFGIPIGIVANSILFSLLHILNPDVLQSPLPVINLFLAGILFSVAREVTDGLWLPIGIHFTWNFFLGNVYGMAVSGMDFGESIVKTEVIGNHIISGGGFGAEGSLITSFVIILFTYLIWKWYGGKNLFAKIEKTSIDKDS